MNVFVTGASGFIGQRLCEKLTKKKHSFFTRYEPNVTSRIDAIVHLSAQAGQRPEQQEAYWHYNSNVIKTIHVLEQAVYYKVPKFIFISSSSVYGNTGGKTSVETDPTDKPLCHYATTKKAGELACYTYHMLHKLDVAVLRPFTVYGPRQKTSMAVPLFTKLINDNRAVKVFGDGSALRDYVYVDDVVDGIIGALSVTHGYEIYNLGCGSSISIKSLVTVIGSKLKKTPVIEYIPQHVGEADNTKACIDKARLKFGYCPKFSIYKGIGEYVDWYLKDGC